MNLFQRYLVEEFAEDYEEGRISRREALKLIASVTGSVVVASSILAACVPADTTTVPVTEEAGAAPLPNETSTAIPVTGEATATTEPQAATETSSPTEMSTAEPTATGAGTAPAQGEGQVSPDDPDIEALPVEFPGEDGATLLGYHAYPAGEGPFPVVLVCHENRGLTPHIQDVTRRLAKVGYAALAVDLLSRQGGSSSLSADDVPGALGNINPDQFVQDFQSGWEYLGTLPYAQTERVGMVGFCFGGGVTWRVATKMPELLAAVPFYGPHPPVEDVPGINASVFAVYAGNDERINSGIPEIEQAMQQNNKTFEKMIYPNVDHAFHNDTGPRYNAEAATDAWNRTLAWFEQYL